MFGKVEGLKKILLFCSVLWLSAWTQIYMVGRWRGLNTPVSMKGHMDPDLWLESLGARSIYNRFVLLYIL